LIITILVATLWPMSSAGGAQIIDRVLAVVAGQPITLSDVRAAMTLGLVAQPTGENSDRAVLNTLIERQLQLLEVNRYLPPEPASAEIDARMAEIRAKFPSDAAFQAALTETGVTADQLRARIRDNLRIENYLSQRFGVGPEPSEDEIQRFYRANDDGKGAARPYAEVREDIRLRLIETRRTALVRDWIAGLRRRVDIAILPM
jgi:parvulin-like peptidyl-prolyl isomerase